MKVHVQCNSLETTHDSQLGTKLLADCASIGCVAWRKAEDEVRKSQYLLRQDEGLRRYLEYMKGTVGTQGRQTYQQLSHDLEGTSPDKADIVGALTKTFKCIALTVEENEEVSRVYSSGCGIHTNFILNRKERKNNWDRVDLL